MVFNHALWSRNRETWPTPNKMYVDLDGKYHFELDAATSEHNPMNAPRFYTEFDDGLKQPWAHSTFVNPPFTRKREENGTTIRENMLLKWVTKAHQEALIGNNSVMLLGSRTGTKWAQDICFEYAKMVCFVRGRLRFGTAKNSAPFDSVLFRFADYRPTPVEFEAFAKWGKTYYLDGNILTIAQPSASV